MCPDFNTVPPTLYRERRQKQSTVISSKVSAKCLHTRTSAARAHVFVFSVRACRFVGVRRGHTRSTLVSAHTHGQGLGVGREGSLVTAVQHVRERGSQRLTVYDSHVAL